MTWPRILLAVLDLFRKLSNWLSKEKIEKAAEDRLIAQAKEAEDARVEKARNARDDALAKFDADELRKSQSASDGA